MSVPIRLTPYTNYINRQLFGNLPLKAAAYRQEVLCEEETVKARRAIFLPGQIDRVTGTIPESTIEQQLSNATSEILKAAPTIAYHIKDASLVDGSIYQGRFKSFIAPRSFYDSSITKLEPRHLKTVGLASSPLGSRFFGHWVIDDCILYRLAEAHGQPLCLRGPIFPEQQQKYGTYLEQNWTPVDRAWIDRLIVYQDYYWGPVQNSLRQATLRSLRERARTHLPTSGDKSLVYLRRGTTGVSRVVQDEQNLMDLLRMRGFIIVDVASKSMEQIVSALANASIVVSVEGSHVAHCVFTVPEDSGLIQLQPPDRFVGFNRGWAESAGVLFGFVVGLQGERGYIFSSSEILHTVDLMMTRRESRAV